MNGKNKKVAAKKYYFIYTILFLCIAGGIFSPYLYYGKAMIINYDALHQYYAAFEYFSDYMQNIVRTLFLTGNLEIPMWDFNIGMGGDVLTSLNHYVIGDPLNLISIFFKNEQLEFVFQFLIILRLYLAGVTFSLFCRKLNYQNWATAIGAFIYIFSMFALFSSCTYTSFTNVLIYLPLLLLGIERVFRFEGGYMLFFVTMLCLISNFYFSYMLAIIALVYCMIRYFVVNIYVLDKEKKGIAKIIRDFVSCVLRVLCPVLGGALASSVILIPVIYVFLNQARSSSQEIGNLWRYSLKEYIDLLGGIFSPKILDNNNWLGYCPFAFFSILLLFQKPVCKKKIKKFLRVSFIISVICLCIPFLGWALNGFAYVHNRWIFGFAFLVAINVVVFFEECIQLSNKNKIILVCGSLVYLILYLFIDNLHALGIATSIIWLFVFLVFIFALDIIKISYIKKYYVMMGICMLCIMYYGWFFYSPKNTNILSSKINIGDTQELAWSESARATKCIKDESFYRIDVKDDKILNESLALKYPSVTFYYSLFDGRITEFNKELNNSKLQFLNMLHGNGGRTYLNLLTNVKYIVVNYKSEVPYGYSQYATYKSEDGNEKIIAKNKLKLPFGYTVNSYLLRKDYEELSSLKKEQAMLQGVVLEEKKEGMQELAATYSDNSVPYSIKETKGLEVKGNVISVTEPNAILTIKADIPDNVELFIQGKKLQFKAYSPLEYPEYYGEKGKSKYEQQLWKQKYKDWKQPDRIDVKVKIRDEQQVINFYQKTHRYFWEQEDFLFSLGCHCSGKQNIMLTFSAVGEYTFSGLELLTENMTVLSKQVNKIKEEQLKKLKFSTNRIEGTIETTGNKMLLLSVPYSSGWTALVDGKEQELICANTMWSAIYLEDEGEHDIVLQYRTPGLKIGLIITGVTLIITGVFYCIFRYKKFLKKSGKRNYDKIKISDFT